ncbi:MAG TPA: DUF456 domain-containing protein [Methylophilaceae bacterium]|mgnify:FL=1|nr:DUF456 domain-containing protein [Methylophilaceae bacterium]
MDWLWLLAAVLVLVGIAGTILPMLPGIPLVFVGLFIAAWIDGFAKVSVLTIIIIGLIALLALIVEFVASFITVKKAGASKYALWGAAIGGLIGFFTGPLGLIIGTAVGAAIGELLAEKETSQATAVGIAAGLGFVVALVAKVVLLLIMLAIFAYAYYL